MQYLCLVWQKQLPANPQHARFVMPATELGDLQLESAWLVLEVHVQPM